MRAQQYTFPDPHGAQDDEGVVALGGPINADRLLAAYRCGIFPWSGDPVRWCSPDPRAVFQRIYLPRKLDKLIRQGGFSVSCDRAFEAVVRACAEAHGGEAGETWITPAFVAGYAELHARGHAHSVEIWQGETLVGGLYGVQIGGLFSGESMFHRVSNASKVAFAVLIDQLRAVGTVLLDAQVLNRHTYRLGAVPIRRRDYLHLLGQALSVPTHYDGQRWPPQGPAAAGPSQSRDVGPAEPEAESEPDSGPRTE